MKKKPACYGAWHARRTECRECVEINQCVVKSIDNGKLSSSAIDRDEKELKQ